MEVKHIKCPYCGASIDGKVYKGECYCSYCGSRVLVDGLTTFDEEETNIVPVEITKNTVVSEEEKEDEKQILKNKKRSFIVFWLLFEFILGLIGYALYFAESEAALTVIYAWFITFLLGMFYIQSLDTKIHQDEKIVEEYHDDREDSTLKTIGKVAIGAAIISVILDSFRNRD